MINDIEEFKIKIKNIIDEFLENEDFLLQIDVHERSLAFRLGLYLAEQFKNWDVDMEYNRKGIEIKRIERKNKMKNIFPDLIVHKRNDDSNNYIAIQIKKNTNYELNSEEMDKDRKDLMNLTLNSGKYNYRFGILFYFYCKQNSTTRPLIEYYENGKFIEREN